MKTALLLIGLLGGGLLAFGEKLEPLLANILVSKPVVVVPTVPVVPPYTPSASEQAAVAPITAALRGLNEDALVLSDYFDSLAEVAAANPDAFTSVQKIEDHLNRSTSLVKSLYRLSLNNRNEIISNAIKAMIGDDESKPIPNSLFVSAMKAIAWGCREATKPLPVPVPPQA